MDTPLVDFDRGVAERIRNKELREYISKHDLGHYPTHQTQSGAEMTEFILCRAEVARAHAFVCEPTASEGVEMDVVDCTAVGGGVQLSQSPTAASKKRGRAKRRPGAEQRVADGPVTKRTTRRRVMHSRGAVTTERTDTVVTLGDADSEDVGGGDSFRQGGREEDSMRQVWDEASELYRRMRLGARRAALLNH